MVIAIDHRLVVPEMVKCRDIILYPGATPLLEMCKRTESMCPHDHFEHEHSQNYCSPETVRETPSTNHAVHREDVLYSHDGLDLKSRVN